MSLGLYNLNVLCPWTNKTAIICVPGPIKKTLFFHGPLNINIWASGRGGATRKNGGPMGPRGGPWVPKGRNLILLFVFINNYIRHCVLARRAYLMLSPKALTFWFLRWYNFSFSQLYYFKEPENLCWPKHLSILRNLRCARIEPETLRNAPLFFKIFLMILLHQFWIDFWPIWGPNLRSQIHQIRSKIKVRGCFILGFKFWTILDMIWVPSLGRQNFKKR